MSCFHVKVLQCYIPPDECLQVFRFHVKATYLPVHLLPFEFTYANVQFDKNAYPEMWKFWKYYKNNILQIQIIMFWNMSEGSMSMLVSDILNVNLTEVQIWHKGQDYSSVLKWIADVCCHHLLHQQFVELIQHNSSLVDPCLWNNIYFSGRHPHHSYLPIAHMPWEDIWHPRL